MAAAGPRGARAAGGLAEGFICKSGQGMDAYRDLLEAVDDGARAAGRDPATIARTIEVSVSYGSSWDSDDVMDLLGRYVDLGFTDVVVHSLGRDQAGFIAAFSRDVLAGLRERLDRRTAFTTGVC
jgi:coenzyme F420-dependent glucose-6-phosphate dehydrogenase